MTIKFNQSKHSQFSLQQYLSELPLYNVLKKILPYQRPAFSFASAQLNKL